MIRDGDWSRGEAPTGASAGERPGASYAGYHSPHAGPHTGQAGAASTEGSRIESLLHSVIDRLEENEIRYNDALGSLERRLGDLSMRAAGSAGPGGMGETSDAFSRLGSQAAELAQQVRSASQPARSGHRDERFRAMEDRISEFAARMQQRGAMPASTPPRERPRAGAAPHGYGARPAGEMPGYYAPHAYEPSRRPAPSQPASPYYPPDTEFARRFADAAAGFEQSLAAGHATAELEAINARIDDLVDRFDSMTSGRSADHSMLETVEIQLNNLAAQFDQAREHYARVDAIETNLVHLMEMTRQSDSRLEEVAMRAAREVARNAGGLHGEIAERLDAVQRELRALSSLNAPAQAHRPQPGHDAAAAASPRFQPPPQVHVESYAEPHVEPQSGSGGFSEPVAPPGNNSPTSLREELERSRVGATIPDFQPAPHFTGLGERSPQPPHHFDDDADFLASARRAAAAAASSVPPEPQKKGLLSSLRRSGRPRGVTSGETAKPRSLFVAATVFLMIASAALIYGRMNDDTGGSLVEAPGSHRPANDHPSAAPDTSSMLSSTPGFADRKDESKLPAGAAAPAERDAFGRAPLAMEQRPQQSDERNAADDDGRKPAREFADVHIDPGIPGIAVRIMDAQPTAANADHLPVRQAALQQPSPQQSSSQQSSMPAPSADRMPTVAMPPAAIGPQSLRLAAQRGDANAQYEVASRYSRGSGVTQDYAEAAAWFSRAASQGFAPAQYRLAALYERGRGVQKDQAMAKLWYERAAKAGNIRAMHNLAVIYSGAGDHRPDHAQAGKWFSEAARRGLSDSQFNLGILHEAGLGVKQDMEEAYRWFALAAAQGDAEAGKRKAAVAAKLRSGQARIIDQAVRQWRAAPLVKAANEVGAPEGGWQAAARGNDADERQVVLQAQSLLNSLGYQAGVPDGIEGPQTVSAVRRFQERNGLPVDGRVSSELLSRLAARAS